MDQTTLTLPATPSAIAFRLWYEDNFRYVWRTIRRFGVRQGDIADVVQEVFVIAWRRRATVVASSPIRPWLFGIAYRVAARYRRKAWYRLTFPIDPAEIDGPELGSEQKILVRDELVRLDAALNELPLKYRAVLLLHDLEEAPMHEVASALGIPKKTGYSRLNQARKLFRQAYRRLQLGDLLLVGNMPSTGETT